MILARTGKPFKRFRSVRWFYSPR